SRCVLEGTPRRGPSGAGACVLAAAGASVRISSSSGSPPPYVPRARHGARAVCSDHGAGTGGPRRLRLGGRLRPGRAGTARAARGGRRPLLHLRPSEGAGGAPAPPRPSRLGDRRDRPAAVGGAG